MRHLDFSECTHLLFQQSQAPLKNMLTQTPQKYKRQAMKNNKHKGSDKMKKVILILLALALLLSACKAKQEPQPVVTQYDSYYSIVRPDEDLQLNTPYTDTFTFVRYVESDPEYIILKTTGDYEGQLFMYLDPLIEIAIYDPNDTRFKIWSQAIEGDAFEIEWKLVEVADGSPALDRGYANDTSEDSSSELSDIVEKLITAHKL